MSSYTIMFATLRRLNTRDWTSPQSTAAAVLAGITLAGSLASALSLPPPSSPPAPAAPAPGMAPGPEFTPSTTRELATLNRATQGFFRLYPFAIVQPKGTMKMDERPIVYQKYIDLDMADTNGNVFRSVQFFRYGTTDQHLRIRLFETVQGYEDPIEVAIATFKYSPSVGSLDVTIITEEAEVKISSRPGDDADSATITTADNVMQLKLNGLPMWNSKVIDYVLGLAPPSYITL
ncbi:hypothetical protein THASP1DRAFT_30974 [Thamnocephalis sphaerospora]|uniref:Uncharacterized protein n=1 Tax=Thamnocephalis sphaerospora TaxID=78915 RepID=A0A4V1IWD8_9FUNG|nr:hypothetical protein THASP1DRAFT_30974 [Thamnocephalis sphaerospora]|eukprot:RKP07209.1 hypothetical protein THASP1DRAFT_30974 [Thamnocephalis sphaerospora]